MIDFLQLSCKQRVLLVGEGNFSFTISLLRKLHFAGASVPANLVSTCYQKYKDLATDIKSNARLANQLGEFLFILISQSNNAIPSYAANTCDKNRLNVLIIHLQELKSGLVLMPPVFMIMKDSKIPGLTASSLTFLMLGAK